MLDIDKLWDQCLFKADYFIKNDIAYRGTDLLTIAELLMSLELEKIEKNNISDSKLDYNDEIVSIETVGVKETIDISVSGDNLFYCNDILTKNSFGLPMTVDWMFAIVRTEELDQMGQLMIKQLKSRYNDVNYYKRFVIGIDITKFKLYDVDNPNTGLVKEPNHKDDEPVFDKSTFGSRAKKEWSKGYEEIDFS